MYPNAYTILVGRPGVGKGAAVNPAMDILRKANTANVLSDRLTIEYVLEELAKGFPTTSVGPAGISFGTDSSCLLYAPELGVFARNSEHTLPDLSDLWDCRDSLVYGTRGKGKVTVKMPCPSMLACSSPKWLIESIPHSAIGGGFTRRVNFVFATEKAKLIPYPSYNGNNATQLALIEDLRWIHTNVRGDFKLAFDARKVFETYYMSAAPDEFDDEATANYISSKWVHAIKLAMALSAAQRDDRIIRKAELEEAIVEVEAIIATLKKVFRASGESELVVSGDKVLRYIEKKGYASYQELMALMWRDMTKYELESLIQGFVDGGMIVPCTQGNRTLYKTV